MIDTQSYIESIELASASDADYNKKLYHLKAILQRLVKELTKDETLQFSNLFSRIVFVAHKYALPKQLEWKLQRLRVLAKQRAISIDKREYMRAHRAIIELCSWLSGDKTIPSSDILSQPETLDVTQHLRVQILSIDREQKHIHCVVDNATGTEIVVAYDMAPHNTAFNTSVARFWEGAQLNLIDCSQDKNGYFIPKIIVLEPDYLIDASAIAECFRDYATSALHYFQKKFEEVPNRSYLLLGNLANFFLDELVFAKNPHELSFKETFLKSFKQAPFEYTSCADIQSDEDFRAFMQKAEMQFENIKRVITRDFPQQHIDVHECILEPSFFSEKYGFQGRLDLLQTDTDKPYYKIVELKSGRLPYPEYDSGKVAINNYVQTVVYRLMIESVFGKDARHINAAILYSAAQRPGENLRFSAEYQSLEKKVINLRNQIVANEYLLTHGDNDVVDALMSMLVQQCDTPKRLPLFYTQSIENFLKTVKQASELEAAYFKRFVRFISCEIYMQKIGDAQYESPTGVAALWNTDFEERAEALDVLFDLTIEKIDYSSRHMTILFRRNLVDNDIVNFRKGEICIVYPRANKDDSVLNKQILKGSIADITAKTVEVRLRYKQKNRTFFKENKLWAIEHDTLDATYNSMYKSLFSFLKASKKKRDLLLGQTKPKATSDESVHNYPEDIIAKAMAAEDYFLIVGPPGTGKTSIFARRLIEEYHHDPTKSILVLAYTNRAVDELCQAIHAAFGCDEKMCDKYIRVGTELSCAPSYRHRLLQNISEKTDNREMLRKEIYNTRIFVSTLASINGKLELFDLKKFDVAIVDEASQIVEPQIIGLLPRFDKFILIGDHNQLSAIVLQNKRMSRVTEPILCEAGVEDCGEALFERLIRTCVNNKWHHAYAQLTHQGRMHETIAAFPAKFFYNDNLFVVRPRQTAPLSLSIGKKEDTIFAEIVATHRVAFFSTEKMMHSHPSDKINVAEAESIIALVQAISYIYATNNRPLKSSHIGIITPYRNQIARIRHAMVQANIPDAKNILVDTVERFQGSQRDIILISFCVNRPYQLDFLCAMSSDGKVDRKLNVALTRAREQLFMVGNARVLRTHPMYALLLDFYKDKKSYFELNLL